MRTLLLFFVFVVLNHFCYSETVTNLSGFYRDGQVFLTWKCMSSAAYYKVYRSTVAITSSGQLASCEYLGYVDKLSAEDHCLSQHDASISYLRLDSNGTPLTVGTGLMVATTLVNGNYYYAVTSLLNGVENKTIIAGTNSLQNSITENVSVPLPVFQEQRLLSNGPVNIYANFFSTKQEADQPPESTAGCIVMDFVVNGNYPGAAPHPLQVLLHGGGEDFFWDVQTVLGNEINLGMEERLPNVVNNGWWGGNENYDIFKGNNQNTVPVSGIDYNYEQQIISRTIDWAIHHLPVDSNRIYLNGASLGAGGAFMYAITYPERIAAIKITSPCLNYGFENDYNPLCSLNAGGDNRKDGDVQFGTVSTNLMTNLGIHFYDAVNGAWVMHTYIEKNYPFIFAINGKNDALVGWTEKTIFYDSLKTNHAGGYYFWDESEHGGNGGTWNDANFDLFRYRNDQSFPAFANCSNDEDYGIGDNVTGEAYGTVNGSLDWIDSSIEDGTNEWGVKMFIRDLQTIDGVTVVYPDSCMVDVTPRRLQKFQVPVGATFSWTVTHHNNIVQSGSQVYNGGLIVIPHVKVYKDSSSLGLLYDEGLSYFFKDKDGDGYGNHKKFVEALTPPQGYVADSTDCNDMAASIHPGATETCNNIDDNCNGQIDEGTITVSISTNDPVSFCAPGTATLAASPTGAGYIYQWYNNGIAISGATGKNYVAFGAGNYTCRIYNGTCHGTSNNIVININPSPVATITPGSIIKICPNGSIALAANAGTGLIYQWLKDYNVIVGATEQTYVSGKGNFSVGETNQYSCIDTSAVTQIKNYTVTAASIKILNSGNLNLCTGTVKLHALPNGPGFMYIWFRNDMLIPGATSINLTVTTVGKYKVKVTNVNGCISTSENYSVISSCKLSGEPSINNQLLSIYPNPNNGHFTIDLSIDDNINEQAYVEIFNAYGQIIYSGCIKMVDGKLADEVTLDATIVPGLYFTLCESKWSDFQAD